MTSTTAGNQTISQPHGAASHAFRSSKKPPLSDATTVAPALPSSLAASCLARDRHRITPLIESIEWVNIPLRKISSKHVMLRSPAVNTVMLLLRRTRLRGGGSDVATGRL